MVKYRILQMIIDFKLGPGDSFSKNEVIAHGKEDAEEGRSWIPKQY